MVGKGVSFVLLMLLPHGLKNHSNVSKIEQNNISNRIHWGRQSSYKNQPEALLFQQLPEVVGTTMLG